MSRSIVLPEPVEDELVHGFLGRIRVLNGFSSLEETLRRLKAEHAISSDRESTPLLIYLARALRVSDEELAVRHTMAPLFNTVTRIDAHRPDWTPAQTALRRFGTLRSKVYKLAPRSCTLCVSEDREQYGVGIWRRPHQIPGIDFCARHRVRLSVESGLHAFEGSPGMVGAAAERWQVHPLAIRYLTVCESLFKSPSAHHLRDVRLRVLEHLHLHHLPSTSRSDNLESVLPGAWDFIRSRHIPSANQAMLDGVAIDLLEAATAFDATGYAAALSLVFANQESAIAFHHQPTLEVQRFIEGAPHPEFWTRRRAATSNSKTEDTAFPARIGDAAATVDAQWAQESHRGGSMVAAALPFSSHGLESQRAVASRISLL